MSNFNPLVQPTVGETLQSSIKAAAVWQDALNKQAALIATLCDHYGDNIPVLYQLLQSAEGNSEWLKVIQGSDIAALELLNRNS